MMEYIEKEKAARILREEAAAHYPTAFHVGLYAAARAIDSIPAADVRPVVKAKIVDMRYTEDDGEWKCSHCGWQFTLCVCGKDVTSKIHFCPNCGASMKEES